MDNQKAQAGSRLHLDLIRFDEKDILGAWGLIKKASRITLLAHYKPDGDTVSACAALDLILRRLDKSVECVYPNTPEFEFKRQPKKVFINEHSQTPDLLIACDTANYDRLYWPHEFKAIPLINIDHHVSNTIKGVYDFIEPNASSACEILYNLICAWDESMIDKDVAEILLFGIAYDSRVFHTQATYPSTLRIAADLMERGANLFQLKVELLSNKNPNIIKLWGLLFDRIQISKNKTAVWSYITQQDLKNFNLTLTSLVGFNDFLSDIAGIDVTLLFYETEEGETKVSLRSKEFDVNKFAAQFGGGGHKNAAGILSSQPLQEFMARVVAAL